MAQDFFQACDELGITERAYYRWIKQLNALGTVEDLRPITARLEPVNKLSKQERNQILEKVNELKFASMLP